MFKLPAYQIYLGLFALFSTWPAQIGLNDKSTPQKNQPTHRADFFSEGYQKWQMNAEGLLESFLTANKMTHYSDDKKTHLDHPTLIFYGNAHNQHGWQLHAERGVTQSGGEQVWLEGQVHLHRDSDAPNQALDIVTSDLTIFPQRHFAQTQQLSTITRQNNVTSGIGMNIQFGTSVHLELLSQVHGRYESQKK